MDNTKMTAYEFRALADAMSFPPLGDDGRKSGRNGECVLDHLRRGLVEHGSARNYEVDPEAVITKYAEVNDAVKYFQLIGIDNAHMAASTIPKDGSVRSHALAALSIRDYIIREFTTHQDEIQAATDYLAGEAIFEIPIESMLEALQSAHVLIWPSDVFEATCASCESLIGAAVDFDLPPMTFQLWILPDSKYTVRVDNTDCLILGHLVSNDGNNVGMITIVNTPPVDGGSLRESMYRVPAMMWNGRITKGIAIDRDISARLHGLLRFASLPTTTVDQFILPRAEKKRRMRTSGFSPKIFGIGYNEG